MSWRTVAAILLLGALFVATVVTRGLANEEHYDDGYRDGYLAGACAAVERLVDDVAKARRVLECPS